MPQPPGPSGYPLLGVLPLLLRDPLSVLQEAVEKYGDVVCLGTAPRRVYLVNHPALIQHVLQEYPDRYAKGRSVDRIRPLLGEGLTTSDGALWQRQRRLLAPLFHPHAINNLAPLIVRTTGNHLDRWRSRTNADGPLELMNEMLNLARAIILKMLFGSRPETEMAALHQAAASAIEHTERHVWRLSLLPHRLSFTFDRNLQRSLAALDALLHARIKARREKDTGKGDMLGALLEMRDPETGKTLEQKQLRDELVTLLVAGHTTAAAALCWIWILLDQHPLVRKEVERELEGLPDREALSFDDMEKSGFLRVVVDEALRLYPPTWVTARTALVDDVIGGYRIPAGAIVLLCPWLLHRDQRFWSQPEMFLPERFRDAPAEQRPPFSYFPFGGGPRGCPGRSLALLEIRLILALALSRCRLELLPDQNLTPHARITLRPAGPVWFFPHKKGSE